MRSRLVCRCAIRRCRSARYRDLLLRIAYCGNLHIFSIFCTHARGMMLSSCICCCAMDKSSLYWRKRERERGRKCDAYAICSPIAFLCAFESIMRMHSGIHDYTEYNSKCIRILTGNKVFNSNVARGQWTRMLLGTRPIEPDSDRLTAYNSPHRF